MQEPAFLRRLTAAHGFGVPDPEQTSTSKNIKEDEDEFEDEDEEDKGPPPEFMLSASVVRSLEDLAVLVAMRDEVQVA